MLPKSRRALTIQEIAALARSSLHGFSQVVKDHVTKPTAMAQGRVAHLIEWKGWCKPTDTPSALESHLTSYSHLTEGEQEARFAAGVAEQFAIAEAKLRAWSSVDGDESNDDSYDEDFLPANEPVTQSTVVYLSVIVWGLPLVWRSFPCLISRTVTPGVDSRSLAFYGAVREARYPTMQCSSSLYVSREQRCSCPASWRVVTARAPSAPPAPLDCTAASERSPPSAPSPTSPAAATVTKVMKSPLEVTMETISTPEQDSRSTGASAITYTVAAVLVPVWAWSGRWATATSCLQT
uniref:Family with sequence similarity 131 member A n=1 Tax=Cyprinus carpio carpio TaxID=630221 RepID=A0A9J7YUI8_CYPCA